MDIITIVLLINIGWMAHVIFAQHRMEKQRKAQKPPTKKIPNDFPFDCGIPYRFDD